VLVRRDALERIGGIEAIKEALIDDVTLAKAIKTSAPFISVTQAWRPPIAPYPHFADIWNMVSRTAFTQLRYSLTLLILTLLGLTVVWLVPVWALAFGTGWTLACGAAACLLAAASYIPTLLRYGRNPLWVIDAAADCVVLHGSHRGSALNRWFGSGTHWKNRAYGTEQ